MRAPNPPFTIAASVLALAACSFEASLPEAPVKDLEDLTTELAEAASYQRFVTSDATSLQPILNKYPIDAVSSFFARELGEPPPEPIAPLTEAAAYGLFDRAHRYAPGCGEEAGACSVSKLNAKLVEVEQIIQQARQVTADLLSALGLKAGPPILGALLTESNFLLERYLLRRMLTLAPRSRNLHHQDLHLLSDADLASPTSALREYCDASARAVETMGELRRQLFERTRAAFVAAIEYHECRGGTGTCDQREYCLTTVPGTPYAEQCFEFVWNGSDEDSAWYYTRKTVYAVAEARAQETYAERFERLLGGDHFVKLQGHLAQRARCEPVRLFPEDAPACSRDVVLRRGTRFLVAANTGTLALYDGPTATPDHLIWTTPTPSGGIHQLCLQPDRSVQMVSGDDIVAWSAPPVAGAAMIALTQSGNLSYLDDHGRPLRTLRP